MAFHNPYFEIFKDARVFSTRKWKGAVAHDCSEPVVVLVGSLPPAPVSKSSRLDAPGDQSAERLLVAE